LPARCALEGHPSFECVLTDISRGGAFIETAENLPFGATLSGELEYPGLEGPLCFSGVIRWKSERGFGLQFRRLGAREKHRLVRLLGELRERQAADGSRASGF
jgi:hypothetical protein